MHRAAEVPSNLTSNVRMKRSQSRSQQPACSGRIRVLLLLLLLLALLGLTGLLLQKQGYFTSSGRAHIVLISIDTLRADRILDPEQRVETPHIDALASDGIQFSECFSHAPMTLPSHTALFSSRAPNESGVLINGGQVPLGLPLLAEHLKNNGYETSGMISMPVLRPNNQLALERGFTNFYSCDRPMVKGEAMVSQFEDMIAGLDLETPQFLFLHFCDPHAPYNAHGFLKRTATVRMDGKQMEEVPTSEMTYWEQDIELAPGEHTFEITSNDDFMLRRFRCTFNAAPKDKPGVRWTRTLTPTFVDGKLLKKTRRIEIKITNETDENQLCSLLAWVHDLPDQEMGAPQRYDAEVEYSDILLGKVVQGLREKGLYDSSLIVLTSDHGETLSEFGGGHGHTVHDSLIRVPLIMKPPAQFKAATRYLSRQSDRLVRHIDLTPTMLQIAAQPPLPGQRGDSLLDDSSDRVLTAETYRPEAETNQITLRNSQYKLIYYIENSHFKLFDVKKDPDETADIFPDKGDQFLAWQQQLKLIGSVTGAGDTIDFEGLDSESKEQLQALGYFGDE